MSTVHHIDPKMFARIAVLCVSSPIYSNAGMVEYGGLCEGLALISECNTRTYNAHYNENESPVRLVNIIELMGPVIRETGTFNTKVARAIRDLNSLAYNCDFTKMETPEKSLKVASAMVSLMSSLMRTTGNIADPQV